MHELALHVAPFFGVIKRNLLDYEFVIKGKAEEKKPTPDYIFIIRRRPLFRHRALRLKLSKNHQATLSPAVSLIVTLKTVK